MTRKIAFGLALGGLLSMLDRLRLRAQAHAR